MTRTLLLLAAASAASAAGCGGGRPEPAGLPAAPLPALSKADRPAGVGSESAGPLKAPPPRP